MTDHPEKYDLPGPRGMSRWHVFSFVMSFLGILSIVLFVVTNYIWERQMQDFLLVDAITDMKGDLTAFHFGLEEYLNGDSSGDAGNAKQRFFHASDLSRKLLTGGQMEQGKSIRPLEGDKLRSEAQAVAESIDKLQEITLVRLRERPFSGAGTDSEREFDRTFNDLINKIDRLEDDVEKKIISTMDQFRGLFRTIVVVWSVIIIGAFVGLSVMSRRRRRSEARLSASEQKYRSLVDSTDDSIYLVDDSYNYLFINRKHLRRIGIDPSNVENLNYGDLHTENETLVFRERVDRVFSTGESAQYEHQSLRDQRYFLQTLSPVRDTDGRIMAVTVVSKNITERKRMEDELRALSLTDDLTGLYNRRGFMTLGEQQLKVAARLNKRLYLISADLDGLKTINDMLGHKEGDAALVETANILRANFRESDIIARIGGDEFAIMPIEMTDDSAMGILKRIEESFDSYGKAKKGYTISVSMGIAVCDPENPCSLEHLMELSDASMYEKKRLRKTFLSA